MHRPCLASRLPVARQEEVRYHGSGMKDLGVVPRAGLSLEESYRHVARLTKAHARNFSYSFWFLDLERRRGISAIYAYSRRLDDCVDAAIGGTIDPAEAQKGLEELRALLKEPRGDPLGPALADTIQRFRIPHQHFHDLIAGMEMDLETRR